VGAAGAGPVTVVDQRGEYLRLVQWVQQADWYIQTLYTHWNFLLVKEASISTTAHTSTISKPVGLKQWDFDCFKYSGSPIEAVEYHKVRTEYYDTTIEGPPDRLIILPNNDIRVDPQPDAVYTFQSNYFLSPVRLDVTDNDDVSLIPEDFHMAILGRAMILYGNYEDAPEIKQQGTEVYGEFFARLFDDQMPQEQNSGYKGTGGFFEVIAE
jgi:hypothetical protein